MIKTCERAHRWHPHFENFALPSLEILAKKKKNQLCFLTQSNCLLLMVHQYCGLINVCRCVKLGNLMCRIRCIRSILPTSGWHYFTGASLVQLHYKLWRIVLYHNIKLYHTFLSYSTHTGSCHQTLNIPQQELNTPIVLLAVTLSDHTEM